MNTVEYCHTQIKSWIDLQYANNDSSQGGMDGKYFDRISKTFPYYGILECYRSLGKHFVPSIVVHSLAEIYEGLRNQHIETQYSVNDILGYDAHKLLMDFLAGCLDKHLNVYEYKSYIGMPVFLDNSLPHRSNFVSAMNSRIGLLKALLYDDYAFGARSFLGKEPHTQDRRNDLIIIQRTANIMRTLVALDNLLGSVGPANPDERAALRLLEDCHRGTVSRDSISRGLTIIEILYKSVTYEFLSPINLLLDLSMLPVFVNHEEYNFIRMLQVFEVIFNIVIMGLQNIINCIYDNRVRQASYYLNVLCTLFKIDVHLFRILKTMPREDFHIFRQYTEGASAIQSPQYKMIEVLIGKPTSTRRESPAFQYVPEIRVFLERSGLSLEQVLKERYPQNGYGIDTGAITSPDDLELLQNINLLDNAILSWKKRHFGIASHMIGEIKGTGDTDGIGYLAKFKGELFFPSLDFSLRDQNLAATN